MRAHHRRVVDRLVERFADDPNFLAMLVGGSIARGWERDDSDVDILLIASDSEYARRRPARDFLYFTRDLCDYPDGYVDGKIVDLAFLREVAERGSEPARAAFVGVEIALSRVADLAELVGRISAYPEDMRREKIRSFYAEVQAWQWYVSEAHKRGDPYLLTQAAANLALFGGRLILAHNRVLYPFHKWFTTVLREAPEKPAGFLELFDALLAEPTKASADRFCEAIFNFTEWDLPPEGWPARFMEDVEWAWRRGKPPIADW